MPFEAKADPTTPAKETVRYTIETLPATRDCLATIAKQFKLSQGDVIDVLLEQNKAVLEPLAAALAAKREHKVKARVSRMSPKQALYQQIKSLSPAQLEAALKAAKEVDP